MSERPFWRDKWPPARRTAEMNEPSRPRPVMIEDRATRTLKMSTLTKRKVSRQLSLTFSTPSQNPDYRWTACQYCTLAAFWTDALATRRNDNNTFCPDQWLWSCGALEPTAVPEQRWTGS